MRARRSSNIVALLVLGAGLALGSQPSGGSPPPGAGHDSAQQQRIAYQRYMQQRQQQQPPQQSQAAPPRQQPQYSAADLQAAGYSPEQIEAYFAQQRQQFQQPQAPPQPTAPSPAPPYSETHSDSSQPTSSGLGDGTNRGETPTRSPSRSKAKLVSRFYSRTVAIGGTRRQAPPTTTTPPPSQTSPPPLPRDATVPTSPTAGSTYQPTGSDVAATPSRGATVKGNGADDPSSSPPTSSLAQPNPVKFSEIQCLDEQAQHEVLSTLKNLYIKKVRPLEVAMKYQHFHSAPLEEADFEAKPMVLLVGGYSVGKTSFLRSLVGRNFPGIRIGPEPTTDRFTAIMHSDGGPDRTLPGHALAMQSDKPFQGLQPFGNNFLTRFEGAEVRDSAFLRNITLVDTPGILSGEKQRSGRSYDFASVMAWFADRADMIVVMFDAHKLDISDELKQVLDLLRPHQDKVRVLLNKADSVTPQQLMRVYGALMWQLGRVLGTPEACRIYVGSFWEQPVSTTAGANVELLNNEKQDLIDDLGSLPRNAALRRINELVKRCRSVKVHAHIVHYLRKQMPMTWGKQEKQARLLGRLDKEFVNCARRYNLPRGDFPPLGPFRQSLAEIKDISKFPKLDKSMVREMDRVLAQDVARLLELCAVVVPPTDAVQGVPPQPPSSLP